MVAAAPRNEGGYGPVPLAASDDSLEARVRRLERVHEAHSYNLAEDTIWRARAVNRDLVIQFIMVFLARMLDLDLDVNPANLRPLAHLEEPDLRALVQQLLEADTHPAQAWLALHTRARDPLRRATSAPPSRSPPKPSESTPSRPSTPPASPGVEEEDELMDGVESSGAGPSNPPASSSS